jgi:hypothetical protein
MNKLSKEEIEFIISKGATGKEPDFEERDQQFIMRVWRPAL